MLESIEKFFDNINYLNELSSSDEDPSRVEDINVPTRTAPLSTCIYDHHNRLVDLFIKDVIDYVDVSLGFATASANLNAMTWSNLKELYSEVPESEIVDKLVDLIYDMTGLGNIVNAIKEPLDVAKEFLNKISDFIKMLSRSQSCYKFLDIATFKPIIFNYVYQLILYDYVEKNLENTDKIKKDENGKVISIGNPVDTSYCKQKAEEITEKIIYSISLNFEFIESIQGMIDFIISLDLEKLIKHYVAKFSLGAIIIFLKLISKVVNLAMCLVNTTSLEWVNWYIREKVVHDAKYIIKTRLDTYSNEKYAINAANRLLKINGSTFEKKYDNAQKQIKKEMYSMKQTAFNAIDAEMQEAVDEAFENFITPFAVFIIESILRFDKVVSPIMTGKLKEICDYIANSISNWTSEKKEGEGTAAAEVAAEVAADNAMKDAIENENLSIAYNMLEKKAINLLSGIFNENSEKSKPQYAYREDHCESYASDLSAYYERFGKTNVIDDWRTKIFNILNINSEIKFEANLNILSERFEEEDIKYLYDTLSSYVLTYDYQKYKANTKPNDKKEKLKKETIDNITQIMLKCQTSDPINGFSIGKIWAMIIAGLPLFAIDFILQKLQSIPQIDNILKKFPWLASLKVPFNITRLLTNLKDAIACLEFSFTETISTLFFSLLLSIVEPLLSEAIDKYATIFKKYFLLYLQIRMHEMLDFSMAIQIGDESKKLTFEYKECSISNSYSELSAIPEDAAKIYNEALKKIEELEKKEQKEAEATEISEAADK